METVTDMSLSSHGVGPAGAGLGLGDGLGEGVGLELGGGLELFSGGSECCPATTCLFAVLERSESDSEDPTAHVARMSNRATMGTPTTTLRRQ